jgi:hypothetical protein
MPEPDLNFIARQLEHVIMDIGSLKDDVNVLSAVVLRLDGSMSAITQELRAMRAQINIEAHTVACYRDLN